MRAIVLLCLLTRAAADAQAVQRYFAARRTSPGAAPVRAGYVYRQTLNGPATIQTFHTLHSDTEGKGSAVENATDSEANKLKEKSTESSKEIKSNIMTSKGPMMTSKNSISFSEHKLWPETDATGKLKLAASRVLNSYIFRADDEDIRTGFRNPFDIWPFPYQKLYEPKKDLDVEKVKDKRSAIPKLEKVIPVHEKVDETTDDRHSENKDNSTQDYKHTNAATTDKPIFGNQPFSSYAPNDYFDKTDEDDLITFKGHPWGKEFDQEMGLQNIDDYAKRVRRLEGNSPKANSNREENKKKMITLTEHDASRESLNSKGRDSHREAESSEKRDDSEHSYDGMHQYDGDHYRGFKDFADSFAHRFGSEDHNREANYAKKNNANKGEKKKGFRTIHHKDEYQEHHDFFDNTGNSENADEKGSSKVHIGGSEALLRSSAGAAAGSDVNKLRNAENIERNQYERNHEDKQRYNGIERELDHYRDVAKHTALSDDEDYVDRYMI
ncbi:uncharacterized protein LOC123876997 [Maniola jurtina]|uniref:uncharacterized protein LOC123876997 n=1 Tax=Maniola jurtina TaxID=191418 RepID=UPI001E68B0AD|nr:uncharacterized protein LOC123876997 [Maniola jurtina]